MNHRATAENGPEQETGRCGPSNSQPILEARWLGVALHSIGDAVIATDSHCAINFMNPVAEMLTGWTTAEAIGQPLETVFRIVNEETGQTMENPVPKVLRDGMAVAPANPALLMTREGTERSIEDSAAPIRDQEGQITGAVLVFREVTERRRRNARLAVTQILAQETEVETAAAEIIAAVCSALKWDVGCFWRLAPDEDILRCGEFRQVSPRNLEAFREATLHQSFRPGISLPGRVWKSRQPLWVSDIVADPEFVRSPQAEEVDLHGAFACPVTAGEKFLGAIEFFSQRIQPPDEDLLEMMTTISRQFGQFIERRHAEQQLRLSEQELSDFFENANLGLHWIGPDGIIQRVNQAGLEMLGYCREEYVGRPIADFHVDPPVIEDILARLAQGETLRDCPARLRAKDGSIRDVLINSSVLFEDGKFIHTRCFTLDVTEAKRAQHDQALLAAIVESSEDAIVAKNLEGIISSWNAGAERLFGYPVAEAVGQSIRMIIPPELQDEEDQILERLRRGERIDHYETVRIAKDGRRIDISLMISPLRDREGRIVGVSKIARDITERKRNEEAIRESEAQLAVEADALARLNELSSRLWSQTSLQRGLDEMLEATIELVGADRGVVQILDPQRQVLCITAQRGFGEDFRERFREVSADDESPCGRALRTIERVVIEDVESDAAFAALRPIAQAAGFRAVQSTPLTKRDGTALGMLTTHHRAPYRPSAPELRRLDLYARQAADFIERCTTEQALRESEQRFARFMEHLPGLAWIKDLEGRYVFANDAAVDAFQCSREALYGKTDEQVFPPDTAAHFRENDQRALEGEAGVQTVEALEHPNGRIHYSVVNKFPILNADGQATLIGGMAIDITERKQAEAALQAKEAELELIASTTPLMLTRCSRDLKYRFVNRAFAALFDMTPEQIVGRSISDLIGEQAFSLVKPYIDQVLQGEQVEFESQVSYREAGPLWVRVTYIPECDEEEVQGWVASIVDITKRKQAEEALRQSEERYRAVVETQSEMVCRFHPEGNLLFVNAAYARARGRTPEELIGVDFWEFIEVADRPQVRAMLDRLRPDSPVVRVENRFDTVEGTRWTLWTNKALAFDANGRPTEVQSSGIDITKRKQVEQALQDNEERLRLALDAGRMGTWEWQIPSGNVYWSSTLEAIHGLPPGTFAGTIEAYQQDIHPEDRPHVLETIRRTIEERQNHHLEYRIVWPDGSVHWLEARGKLFCDESDRPLRLIGVCSDITERKRMEESLEFLAAASKSLSSLTDYQSTLQNIVQLAVPDLADWCAVDMLDDQGELQRIAVAHIDPAKVALAHELHQKYPPDSDAPAGVMKVLRTRAPELGTTISDTLLKQAARDEEHLRLLRALNLKSYICTPLIAQGKILGVLTFVTADSGRRYGSGDLAVAEELAHRAAVAVENARLYQEVREADRRKDEFLAMLAHELRNPLAPIRIGLDFLAMDAVGHEETVALMQEQVEHMVRLVDDLLDVSRIMRGKVELRREPAELATLIKRSVEAVRPLFEGKHQELVISVPQQPIWMNVDSVRIAQVIENLLNNASKYTDESGRIELTAERQDDQAVIGIRDTGIGIEPDLLPRVFDLFTQSSRALDRAQGGLGIGLTLVQRLLEMHGGSVTVQSAGLGHGSTFTVRLPTIKAAAPPKPEKSTPAVADRRILIVDDNVAAARMLALLLKKLGSLQIDMAYDGPSALAKIQSAHPEIVLLVVGLPGMDGHQVAKKVRQSQEFDDVLLVALTGYGQEEDRRRSKEAGFDEHLVKPPSMEQILAILATSRLPQ